MSVHLTSTVWKLPKIEGLNFADKAILLKLADHADSDGGSCFPSRARIAEECWCSEKTVTRSIDRLIKLGFVTKKFRKNTTNIYQIKVSKLEALVAQKTLKSRGDRKSFTGGTESPAGGDRESPTQGTESPPNHQYNHQYNRQSSSRGGKKLQQQPRLTEEQFKALKNEMRPDLPDTLKDGETLYAKWIGLNSPSRWTEDSARYFLFIEKPEKLTKQEKAKLKAEEDQALIDQCYRQTGYNVWSADEARRRMRQFNEGKIRHASEREPELALAGYVDDDPVPF